MNPHVNRQQWGFYTPVRPLLIFLAAKAHLSRLVWLPPGTYDLTVLARPSAVVSLDQNESDDGHLGPIHLTGFVHRLQLDMPLGGKLTGVTITPSAG